MTFFSKTKRDYTSKLREVLQSSHASEALNDLPDRFSHIIQQYDSLDVAPQYRRDVHTVLSGAVAVAEALVDSTFPVEHASTMIAEQMEVLSRVLRYLSARPTATGYAILIPEQGRIVGQFSTEQEAESQREHFIAMGASQHCQVVPTRVISQFAIQPRRRAVLDGSMPPKAFTKPVPTFDDAPLPAAIKPNDGVPVQEPIELNPPVNDPTASLQAQIDALNPKARS